MFEIFLTPASIGYLTQFILSIAITITLIKRLRYRTTQLVLLTVFFGFITLFIGLLFLDAVLSPFPRLLIVYAQNTVLSCALVFLIQFAYQFPQSYQKNKWTARISLFISAAYVLSEGVFMVYRYDSLLIQNTVYYRPLYLDYFSALVLLLIPIAFIQQCVESDPRPIHWIKKFWKPQGKNAKGARTFIFTFGILFFLGLVNILRGIAFLSTEFYNASLSIGILFVLWMFITNYINFIPGGLSVQTKLLILPLTLFLAILGSVGWIISPTYIATYQPDLTDHQTIRFIPNTSGGYEVAEVDFTFEEKLGKTVMVDLKNEGRNHKIEYDFPFYGINYSDLYVTSSGVITFGEPFWQSNMQSRYINFPAIFPLMIDLDSNLDGGLYIWEDTDLSRLVITWYQLPAAYQNDVIFTFQTVLYSDGTFDITYNGLPSPFIFASDETPSANLWVRGIISGKGNDIHTSEDQLLNSSVNEKTMIIENYQLDFRRYLHKFMTPLTWVVLGGSLLMIFVFPRLLKFSIIKPLESLVNGVHQVEKGDLNISIPIHNEDEVGFLTQHFNKMTSRLNDLITGLEKRVADRTLELSDLNKDLRKRLEEINLLQAELREQSIRDPLTNAFNRRYMMEILEIELSRAKRDEQPLSLIMIDVDHFKEFNDEFGHQAGDMILEQLVDLVTTHIRKEDSVCRYGGEEFMVILPKASLDDARIRAEEFRSACEKMILIFENRSMTVTISLGVMGRADADISTGEMLKIADEALYLAKGSGRNCVFVFNKT